MNIHSNRPVNRDTGASVLVDHQRHGFVRVLPGFTTTPHPHVEGRFVEVQQHSVFVNQLRKFQAEVENGRPLHSQRLLVRVVAEQVSYAVLHVEVPQHLPADSYSLVLFQQDAAVFEPVTGPFAHRLFVQQVVFDGTLQYSPLLHVITVVCPQINGFPSVSFPASQSGVYGGGPLLHQHSYLVVAHDRFARSFGVAEPQVHYSLQFSSLDRLVHSF